MPTVAHKMGYLFKCFVCVKIGVLEEPQKNFFIVVYVQARFAWKKDRDLEYSGPRLFVFQFYIPKGRGTGRIRTQEHLPTLLSMYSAYKHYTVPIYPRAKSSACSKFHYDVNVVPVKQVLKTSVKETSDLLATNSLSSSTFSISISSSSTTISVAKDITNHFVRRIRWK